MDFLYCLFYPRHGFTMVSRYCLLWLLLSLCSLGTLSLFHNNSNFLFENPVASQESSAFHDPENGFNFQAYTDPVHSVTYAAVFPEVGIVRKLLGAIFTIVRSPPPVLHLRSSLAKLLHLLPTHGLDFLLGEPCLIVSSLSYQTYMRLLKFHIQLHSTPSCRLA